MRTKLGTLTIVEHPIDGMPWKSPSGSTTCPPRLGSDDGHAWKRDTSRWALVPMLAMTCAAFGLLTLSTFSLPFIPRLYFLWSSQAGGVRFGIWGWCLEEGSICSENLGMGYTWEPEVAVPITKALALYPVAAISSFMSLISFILVLRGRTPRKLRVLLVLTWLSFVLAALVFVFMIAMWSVADEKFKAAGWKVRWGPLPWISFIAAFLLLISAINSCRIVSSSSTSSIKQSRPLSVDGWSPTAEETHKVNLDLKRVRTSHSQAPSSFPLKNDLPVPERWTPETKPEYRYRQGHSSSGPLQAPDDGSYAASTKSTFNAAPAAPFTILPPPPRVFHRGSSRSSVHPEVISNPPNKLKSTSLCMHVSGSNSEVVEV